MKRSSWSLAIGSAFTLILAASGCNPENKVTPGAPILLKFAVVTPAGTEAELATEAGAPIPAPPRSYFYALFDRILDPTALETIDADGGVTENDGVAAVEWSGGTIPASTLYFPNGSAKFTLIPAGFFGLPYGVGPSISVFPGMGLPSGSMVTVTLAPDKVRSHDQKTSFKPADGVSSPLTLQTEPLSVSIDVPVAAPADGATADDAGSDTDAGAPPGNPPPVAKDYVVHVAFNNLTSDATKAAIQTDVNVAGVPITGLPIVTDRDSDPKNPAGWTITPPMDGWPAGAVVTVTVGVEATDNFAIPLGSPVSATFTVAQ